MDRLKISLLILTEFFKRINWLLFHMKSLEKQRVFWLFQGEKNWFA